MGIFEFIYYLGYSAKKYYSLKKQKKLPYRVISIGNITTGGTGKTPATIALAEEAEKRGFYPIILTRGYRGKAKGPCFVSSGKMENTSGLLRLCPSVLEAGDEPVLMAEKLKDMPIVKCPDRYQGGMFAIDNLKSHLSNLISETLFILDDGFQHWKLFRDKDILLIDAENPFDNGKLLPIGLLREPLKEIKRADFIVITKADSVERMIIDALASEIKKYNSKSQIFEAGHKPVRFSAHSGNTMPLEWAVGKRVFAFCGIGNPDSFKKTLQSTGCILQGFKEYSDHHGYTQNDLDKIIIEAQKNNAGWIVTSEKDLIRLKEMRPPENLVSLEIEFSVDREFYDKAFAFTP